MSLRWQTVTRADAAILDPRVLAFTAAVSLATVLLFGLAPAWFALRTVPALALKESAQGGGGRSSLQSAWVVAQVALSVALVAGGSLVLRSMQRIAGIDPGYRPQRIVMATIDLSLAGYSAERGTQFLDGLVDRVSRIPGVRSVSLGKSSPAIDWSDRVALFREGEAPAAGAASYSDLPGATAGEQQSGRAWLFPHSGNSAGFRSRLHADGYARHEIGIDCQPGVWPTGFGPGRIRLASAF